MARSQIPFTVTDLDGNAVEGASAQVNVRGEGDPAATVYAAETGSGTASNPIVTNEAGRIPGWLEEGSYTITVSGTSLTTYSRALEIVRGDAIVGEAKIANNAISQGKIQDNAVSTAKIQDNAITLAKMADNSVGSDEIIADSVGTSEIAPDAVTTTEINNGAVTSAKIADGTIVNADVSGSAAIAESKLSLASDAADATASRRTLGFGGSQAAKGSIVAAELARWKTHSHTPVICASNNLVSLGTVYHIRTSGTPVVGAGAVSRARYFYNVDDFEIDGMDTEWRWAITWARNAVAISSLVELKVGLSINPAPGDGGGSGTDNTILPNYYYYTSASNVYTLSSANPLVGSWTGTNGRADYLTSDSYSTDEMFNIARNEGGGSTLVSGYYLPSISIHGSLLGTGAVIDLTIDVQYRHVPS